MADIWNPCFKGAPLLPHTAEHGKDQTKIPGGKAGGAASAARPEEDRRESSRKAAVTRAQNQVSDKVDSGCSFFNAHGTS